MAPHTPQTRVRAVNRVRGDNAGPGPTRARAV